MASEKPLPAIPNSRPSPVTLTVEARKHRLRFIRQTLQEGSGVLGDTRDVWVQCIEEALDELSSAILRGGWLAGVKHGRVQRTQRRIFAMQESLKSKKMPEGSASQLPSNTEAPERTPSTLTLHQVKDLVARSFTPVPKSVTKHLLLCIAPLGSRISAPKDVYGIPLPSSAGCKFTNGVYTLPDEDLDDSAANNAVLLGLAGWNTSILDGPTRLVGGTFTFVGVTSPALHALLSRTLRVVAYIHLSLILEQHFLADSHVQLTYPRPRVSPGHQSYQDDQRSRADQQPTPGKTRQRQSFLPSPSGILSFISKKAGLYRSSTIGSASIRSGSLDLERVEDNSTSPSKHFSFIHDAKASLLRSPLQPAAEQGSELPFATTVDHLERSKDLYSTSLGVSIPLPSLIVDLAEKERQYPTRRLKGDEKTGLTSVLGWEGKQALGSGMIGTTAFVRHQGISVLYSQYVPSEPTLSATSEPSSSSSSASVLSIEAQPPVPVCCSQPRWVTYRYYSKEAPEDRSLGETITEWISCAQLPCVSVQCKFKQGQHELRFIHGGLRITAGVQEGNEDTTWQDGGAIQMWQSCSICSASSPRSTLSDGAYLFSFAKFLELLVYSETINHFDSPLCAHTSTSSSSASSSSTSARLHVIRNFHLGPATVSFSVSAIEDIFELKVPRLQILRMFGENRMAQESTGYDEHVDEEKRALRKEIKSWWEGVSDHMDKLEVVFQSDNLDAFRKSLPRLPSSDDAYDGDDGEEEALNTTPTGLRIPGLPFSRTYSSDPQAQPHSYFTGPPSSSSSTSNSSPSTASLIDSDPAQLLSKLRYTFQQIEQSLYQQLSRTPITSLNDVRRSFLCASLGASKRLVAWQHKHIPSDVMKQIGEKVSCAEPAWWAKGCHAIPGGNVVVREDDWGSIIAFTLGTSDYQRELASMSNPRAARAQPSIPISTSSTTTSTGTSFFSPSRGFRFFTSSTQSQPDPDQDDVVWHQPEAFSSVISRKEHPKDATYLLSIRDVLRQKAPIDTSTALSPSRFLSTGPAGSKVAVNTPPSAWAKPDVQLNMQAVVGELSSLPDKPDSADKILHETDSFGPSKPPSVAGSVGSSSGHDRTPSISAQSDETIGPEERTVNATEQDPPPDVPPKDRDMEMSHHATANDATAIHTTNSSSSFANSFTNSIGFAMRLISNRTTEQSRPGTPPKNHHGLLHTDGDRIDDKPHIKYDWTVGTRLKFSCTVYFAKQFDTLRHRCGIEDVYLRSLARSANWAAEGGKSKSNFWKTSDDRFIIKTLVNAWNVADLQVLLELAPSYFRYMDSTANKSTVLAKLLGFYTIEVRNLESGNVHARADLLVMENLFYQHNIVKTFDLKGIQGRKVKPGGQTSDSVQQSKTLFDGEWIEGQQRILTLVRPHSKVILREAIRNDAEFLAKSNIMDYSLLLGVDEEHKQIACGLVDTIGSYTFAKTLEYKAKQGLNSGKEVTVIPPAEYQERFVNALERYFLPCPDKWSQPMDGTKMISDPSLLPSVL